MLTEQIEIQTANGDVTIKLEFARGPDRWAHRWLVATDNSELEIMSSEEGTPIQNWPSSPPLQEVSRHCLDGTVAILGVGMAGKSHWSASYSLDGVEFESAIKSDLACLQKSTASDASLGSKYSLGQNCQVQALSDRRVELLLEQIPIGISAISGTGFETGIRLADRTISITPERFSDRPNLATRWGFEIATI